MNKEPTQERIKEFWEWCGLKLIQEAGLLKSGIWTPELWKYPDGKGDFRPSIDLNNLFKYAVPKVGHCQIHKWGENGETFLAKAYLNHCMGRAEDTNPALALFWALDKVRKETQR